MITSKQFVQAAIAALDMGIRYDQEDCQAFVENTVRRAGGKMRNYAGSNDMLRNACSKVIPLDEAIRTGELQAGWLLYIREFDGQEPKQYQGDGMGNASHVGIYTGPGSPEVMHSSKTRGGVAASTLKNGWNMAGPPKEIIFDDVDIAPDQPDQAIVTTPAADQAIVLKKVRMRKSMDTGSSKNIIRELGVGDRVTVLGQPITQGTNTWVYVAYQGSDYTHRGHVVASDAKGIYLQLPSAGDPQPITPSEDQNDGALNIGQITVTLPPDVMGTVNELARILARAQELINSLAGNG